MTRAGRVTAVVLAVVLTPLATTTTTAAAGHVPASLAAPAGPAAPAARDAALKVGAASVDITPPTGRRRLSGRGCTAVGGQGPFTGRRPFGLEEPYNDVNHNGRYDAPDPTTGKGGEPFLDCPTPTATGGTRPPDGRWDGIFVGGGDCCDREADGTVLDRLRATAVVVARGHRRVALVSADNEGVFTEIWGRVRRVVRAAGVHLSAVFPSSTHDESAPDTIGITGPTVTTSGVDPFYVEFLVRRVASAIERADRELTPARIRYGAIRPTDLVPCWSSYPFTADEDITVMQAVARASGRPLATLVNYGIHAEELGFDPKTRRVISGDWWHFLRTSLQRRFGGAPVLPMAGAVGSVEMPLIVRGRYNPVPTGTHTYSSRDGCTTIYSGPPQRVRHESGYHTYTRALGRTVARWAARALRRGAWSRSSRLAFDTRTIQLPVDNLLFLAAGPACVFDYRRFYANGRPTGTGTPPACGAGNQIRTTVGYYRIGDGSFVTAPGELFPFTYVHDFHGRSAWPDRSAGPVRGWVMAQLGGRWRFVVGLGEDLTGYIFPADNEVGTPRPADPNPSDVDRFGCHHVDDAEASSGGEGDIVDKALRSLLPRSRRDIVAAGRYVYTDGGRHHDPTGVGQLGCNAKTSRFSPAPDGGAVGLVVRRHGHLVRYLVRRSGLGPPRAQMRWMDLAGRPQRRPDQQTRGVILPSGRRLWVNVTPRLRAHSHGRRREAQRPAVG